MIQVEAVYRAPIDHRGIVKTRKCRNRSHPFFNWIVQQRLAAELRKLVRHVLRRSRSFEDNAHFVGEMFRVWLKTAHHSVDTVGMKDDAVETFETSPPRSEIGRAHV